MTPRAPPVFGINLPWFDGAYGHDLAPNERLATWPCDFDALRAYRPLVEASDLGFGAVRVWLCENGEGIVTKAGALHRPHPKLLERITILQECARLLGIRVYWTLLDGNAWRREGDSLTHEVLTNDDASARFAEAIAVPIVAAMDPDVAFAVEIVNEPEALSSSCVEPKSEGASWADLARGIRTIARAIRARRPNLMVTAGTSHNYLPDLFSHEPELDAVDLHAYRLDGGLPSRSDLAAYMGDSRLLDGSVPLIVGECGIPDGAPRDALPALKRFLYNAQKNSYDAAFLWRLESVLIDATLPDRHVTDLGGDVRAIVGQLCGP